MKKTVWLTAIWMTGIVCILLLLGAQKRTAQFKTDESGTLVISLNINASEEMVKPWFNKRDGLYYYFLPSCTREHKIYTDSLKEEILIDGSEFSGWDSFLWESGKEYEIICQGKQYKTVFMKSSNIPSLFLETESGTLEHLNADKEVIETGKISVIQENGNVEFQGEAKKVSARGNTTFDDVDKKAYSFTLNKSYPLCGMDAGKKWNLLAMYFEYDKLHTKLVYDLADALGMEYGIDCTWVDLYCNGEYQGLYLLSEAVTVGTGRVDIQEMEPGSEEADATNGGFLIERDIEERLGEDENVFLTEQMQYPFVIKEPEPASEMQTEYIKSYIQKIENLLVAGDKQYKEYLDLDSFAKQFLIDKVVLEPDAMKMSTFFYKNVDSDILKAGPLWDYDRAFGTALPNYALSIGDYPDSMHGWYMELYEEEEFRGKMIEYYRKLLPVFEEMLDTGIDNYAAYISDAVKMDLAKWPLEHYSSDVMSYLEYDSYLSYLKFFLANRLNYLNEVWGISDWQFEVPAVGDDKHLVTFVSEYGKVLETREVAAGEGLEELPSLDGERYQGWGINGTGKIYSSYIPVYEDMELKPTRIFHTLYEIADFRLECLNAAEDMSAYMEALCCEELSVCISIKGDSSLLKQEEVLGGIKAICDYKNPDWLDDELAAGTEYFLLIDRGSGEIRDAVDGELNNVPTTFGNVNYGGESGEKYLYIQENGIDYLAPETAGEITFVVINRYTGEVVGTASFD